MIKKYAIIILFMLSICLPQNIRALPLTYDLRNIDSVSFVSPVRMQQGGTCWTHGTMAAIESNMLMTSLWQNFSSEDYPNLSEYHLDWWNGFNLYFNQDFGFYPSDGLEVHMGGDYRVSAAYLSRGDGAILNSDAPAYENPYPRYQDDYTVFYPRHIVWYRLQEDMSNLDDLKRVIMDYGAVGTCMYVGSDFLNDTTGIHYQTISDDNDPNHSIAIVGWNDTLSTQAELPGAWLCKNSWGETWGSNWKGQGYFWISYYDKHAGRHAEMGFISFQDVELMKYDTIFYHDYHGWRDELEDIDEAANIFIAEANDTLSAVSFYTTEDSVIYTVKIYNGMQNAKDNVSAFVQSGFYAHTGFHTLDLTEDLPLQATDTFIVSIAFDKGAYAYDRTSEVPVLLSVPSIYALPIQTPQVPSKAEMNESMFKVYGQWLDLQYLNESANFCIKALIKQEKKKTATYSYSQETTFSLYPNPSLGKISVNFELPSSTNIKISLYDLNGRLSRVIENKVYPLGYNVDHFDLSGLSNGMYFCIIQANNVCIAKQKIMVIK